MQRRVPSFLLALALGGLVTAMAWSGALRQIDNTLYDHATTRLLPSVALPEVVIVAIDDPSFSELGLSWPWPRHLHAELIESLRAAGAEQIGYDVVFADPTTTGDDNALAEALAPDVTLASYSALSDTPQGVIRMVISPRADFARAARIGNVDLPIDPDGAIRDLPPSRQSMANMLAMSEVLPPPNARIRFDPEGISTVSFYQALHPDTMLPPGLFRGKTVLVGIDLEASPATSADMFRVPATAVGKGFLAGVAIHAHAYRTLASGKWIRPLPQDLSTGFAIVLAALVAFVAAGRPAVAAAGVVAAVALLPVIAATALLLAGIWFSPAAPVLGALLGGVGQVGLDYARERRARREITRGFGQYLAPELVRRLAEDPASLKLGGERRVITVLFCDLRGFTTLSEQMRDDPSALTAILNAAMEVLARAVVDNHGMVDKFIGDCVMAIWNAPTDDPDHARHAVAAAREMIDGIAALSAKLAGEGHAVKLACGVGINTGECTVGNMGSSLRFDYTAIGDPVNLAARLEALTKEFGTPVLLGSATAALLPEEELAELGQTPIKGRVGTETVFAPRDMARASG